MTITNTANSFIFYKITTSPAAKEWDFSFTIFNDTDIEVQLAGAILTLGDDYTVVINGENGGTITLSDDIVNNVAEIGDILYIARDLQYERTTSYSNTLKFDPKDVDKDFDNLVLLSAQTNDFYKGRSMVFPTDYENATVTDFNLLPSQIPQNSILMMVNGRWIAVSFEECDDCSTLRSELAIESDPAQGSKLVGYTDETLFDYLDSTLPSSADDATAGSNHIGVYIDYDSTGRSVQTYLNTDLPASNDATTAGANNVGVYIDSDSTGRSVQAYLNTALPASNDSATAGGNNVGVFLDSDSTGRSLQTFANTDLPNQTPGLEGTKLIGHTNVTLFDFLSGNASFVRAYASVVDDALQTGSFGIVSSSSFRADPDVEVTVTVTTGVLSTTNYIVVPSFLVQGVDNAPLHGKITIVSATEFTLSITYTTDGIANFTFLILEL